MSNHYIICLKYNIVYYNIYFFKEKYEAKRDLTDRRGKECDYGNRD